MGAIVLRSGVEVEHPLELALEFLAAYSSYEIGDASGPMSFDESHLRLANRGGARISAVEIAERELASRAHRLTEVRILDLLIWSVSAAT